MNRTQWLFEYHGLLEKEKRNAEHTKSVFSAARRILATMLGTDLVKLAGVPDDEQPVTPLSILCGRPEVLSRVMEEREVEAAAEAALQDDEYERWSAMMAGEDMVPYDESGPGTDSPADGAVWADESNPGDISGGNEQVDGDDGRSD